MVPKVQVTPRAVTKMQGSNVKAVCSASGSPRPEIRWNLGMLSTPNKVSCSQIPLFTHQVFNFSLLSIKCCLDKFGLIIYLSCERNQTNQKTKHHIKPANITQTLKWVIPLLMEFIKTRHCCIW